MYLDLIKRRVTNNSIGGGKSIGNDTSQKINISSTVKSKDARYPDIYLVVGGDGKKWQCEPIKLNGKVSNADFQWFATNQLKVYEIPF